MKSLHQEVPHLGSLEKKIFLCRKLLLENSLAVWRSCRGTDARGVGEVLDLQSRGGMEPSRAKGQGSAPTGLALHVLGHFSLASLFSKEEGFFWHTKGGINGIWRPVFNSRLCRLCPTCAQARLEGRCYWLLKSHKYPVLFHHCSDRLWRVSCQREHWSFPFLWSSAGEDFLRMVRHSSQTSSFKTHC